MRTRKKTFGFTLIELMVAVGIVGLLAAIAYPSYLNQVRKSRRADGKSLLLRAANRQERFYSTTSPNTYAADMQALGYSAKQQPSGDSGQAADAWYLVSVMTPAKAAAVTGSTCPLSQCYVIEAVPQRDQTKDTRCATLRIDSLGRKTVTGTSDAGDCW